MLGFAEGALLGLPVHVLVWIAVILIPALPQLHFLVALLNIASYCRDYRRTWLILIFKTIVYSTLGIAVFSGVGALIAMLVESTIHAGRPWTGWLGAVNILLVFDVALYMFCRMLYVRRRFDADRMGGRNA